MHDDLVLPPYASQSTFLIGADGKSYVVLYCIRLSVDKLMFLSFSHPLVAEIFCCLHGLYGIIVVLCGFLVILAVDITAKVALFLPNLI